MYVVRRDFCLEPLKSLFAAFSDLNPLNWESSFYMTHSYTSSGRSTYTDDEFMPSMSLFWSDYYICLMVLVLGRCCENIVLFLLVSRSEFTGRWSNFKRGRDVEKEENQMSRREWFFSFLSIKTFVPVSRDTTHKDRSLG